ncbi:MAG: tripartite tricarboxylate transporter permease [Geminicoccaceae bacterium]
MALGFSVAFTLENLAYCFLGVTLGTAIGVLPGIGAIATISMLLPVTYYLDPTSAIILLAGVYYGGEYGGSTAAILLNLPGTPSSAVSCLDGYPMSKQGRAGVALFITAIGSFVGGTLGVVVIVALSPLVIAFAFSFSAPEYFSAMVLALVAVASMARGSPIKGLAMVGVGVLIGMIGTDVISGTARYHLGFRELYDGVNVVALAMGLFGVSEVIGSIRATAGGTLARKVSYRSMVPTLADLRQSVMPILRGFGIGAVVGPLPGIGTTVAAFLSYAAEKRVARDPSRFGRGAIEGVAGPETANNAAAQTTFIPMLTMGIPGAATTAIIMSALMLQGIMPGPRLVHEHPELFWGVVASFWIGNLLLLVLNLPLVGLWVSLLRIPYRYLYPVVISLICIGAYSVNFHVFDVWLVLIIGAVGYGMQLLEFEPAPLLIGYILGPLLEENFRRAMIVSFGDVAQIFVRPISGTLLGCAFLMLAVTIWSSLRQGQREARLQRAAEPAERN